MSTIDVIIPCYNYGRYLGECVESVLDQPGCTVRVLIIDDASPDGSLSAAQEISNRDHRVQVIGHRHNRGHIATYNEGIGWVRSKYMLLLSADDLVTPGALSRATSLMDSHSEIGFVYGRFTRFVGNDRPPVPAVAKPPKTQITPGWQFIQRLCLDPTNPVETATAVVRTTVQKKIGGYRPELPHAGDFEMWLRCAAVGDVGFVDETQAFTRMHSTNMRNAYLANRMLGDYKQRHEAFRAFFSRADSVSDLAELAEAADRALAREIVWAAGRAFEGGEPDLQLRQLARTVHPPITRTSQWWKQSAKRKIGLRGWNAVTPFLGTVRRIRSAP